MTEQDNQPKPKRRWMRFSLRKLLIAVTLFGVVGGPYIYRVEKQRAAVKWVRDNGGTVYYDFEFDDDGSNNGVTQPSVPNWLLDMLGVDYFATVEQVSFVNAELSDVKPIATLTNLKSLYFIETQVTDVTPLASLPNLKGLHLPFTKVSDVTPLAGLSNLEILNLSGTQVRDVAPLAGLTNLERLYLDETQVSDEHLEELKQALPNCRVTSSPPMNLE